MRTERDGAVLVVTLDRPGARNAVDDATLDALLEAWVRAAADPDVGAVVLTGADPAFCAGADLRGPMRGPEELAVNQRARYNANAHAMAALDVPVIAAVNGATVGAGLSLACAADVRIASDRASFRPGFVAIGAVPDAGASWTVPRLIGAGRAFDWFCSTRTLDAGEALSWGLVTEVVPHGDLMARAVARGHELAALPGVAVAGTKALLAATAIAGNLNEQLEREVRAQAVAAAHPDRAAARAAASQPMRARDGANP